MQSRDTSHFLQQLYLSLRFYSPYTRILSSFKGSLLNFPKNWTDYTLLFAHFETWKHRDSKKDARKHIFSTSQLRCQLTSLDVLWIKTAEWMNFPENWSDFTLLFTYFEIWKHRDSKKDARKHILILPFSTTLSTNFIRRFVDKNCWMNELPRKLIWLYSIIHLFWNLEASK
jgi:hypothetical protein